MTPQKEITRAREAERLMNDPLMAAAFGEIEAAILERLRSVDVGARDAQRDLILMLQVVGKVQRIMQTHIETGKLAELTKRENMATRMLRKIA